MKKLYVIILILITTNVSFATHFVYNHAGNPYSPVTILVYSATINSISLEPGDEIAIFDDTLCVGVGVYSNTLPMIFTAGMDDPATQSVVDGYGIGNPMIFKIWDQSSGQEIDNVQATYSLGNGTFVPQGTVVVTLSGIVLSSLSATISASSEVLCFGDATGALEATVAGGVSPLSFSWSNGATTQNISGLIAGTYTVTVSDSNSATASASYSLTEPSQIVITSATSDETCYGAADGSIDLSTSGGTGTLSFAWNNGAVTEDISNLAGGNYSVTVTDGNGCTQTASYSIASVPAIVLSANIMDESCYGAADGSIDLSTSGGTGTLSFAWSHGAVTEDIFSLPPGNYSVTVTDGNGCTQTGTYSISSVPAILLSASITDETCAGAADGSIDLSTSGGTGTLSFAWSNGAVTEDIFNLADGNYSVTVTDGNNCSQSISFILISPPVLSIADIVTQITAPGNNDGAIDLTVSGGVLPYTFIWSNGATTNLLSNLSPGNYSVTVSDNNGCSVTGQYTINGSFCTPLPYSQDFESGTFPSDWSQVSLATDGGWLIGNSATLSSAAWAIPAHSTFVATNDDGCDCNKLNDILISPCFDLSMAVSPLLSLDVFFEKGSYQFSTESAALDVSTDGGTTWMLLDSIQGDYSWQQLDYNLANYVGYSSVKFRIKYSDAGGWLYGCALDNFSIEDNSPNRDIGVSQITRPVPVLADLIVSTGQHVEVVIKNFGLDTINEPVSVFYQLSGGSQVTETVNLYLLPLSTANYTFNQTINIANAGSFSLIAGTSLTNDNNLSNDTSEMVIQVNSISRPAYAITNSDRFVLFDIANPGIEYPFGPALPNDFLAAGTWIDNSWYGVTFNSDLLVMVNLYDAAIDTIGLTALDISGIAYNHASDTLYAIDFYGSLYYIDWQTGAATLIASDVSSGFINLACNSGGNLFSLNINDDNLYSVDPVSGNKTLIGAVGFDASYAQDMEWDHNTGELLMAAYNNTSSSGELRLVDLNTGSTSLLGSFFNGHEYMGFAIPYSPDPLVADFIANVTTGTSPLSVEFTDLSIGNPQSWSWDFGDGTFSIDQNPVHIYTTGGIYTVSLIVSNPYGSDTSVFQNYIEVIDILSSPNWNILITGNNHTILVENSIPVTINATQISNGDYIGIFYDSLGSLACAGYEVWTGQSTAITAWGDDSQTTAPDGFAAGETFKWKIWRASDGIEFTATADYELAMPNTNTYATNGISSLTSLLATTVEYQYINIPPGWSFFSSYIDPFEPNIDSLCAPFVSQVIIAKDAVGLTYWPQYGINMLGNISIGKGYQIKLMSTQIMAVAGLAVQPENTPVTIVQGWSFLGYLRQSPAPVNTMLSPVVSEIIIVKNGIGQIFWPQYGINVIGNMNPGEGYQIRMNSQQTLIYPANTVAFSKTNIVQPQPGHFSEAKNTGNNMTLGLFTNGLTIASEIGVYSPKGVLVGSAVIEGDFTSITIWGDDELTDEVEGIMPGDIFQIQVWDKRKDEESTLIIHDWNEGDAIYLANKIAIAQPNFEFSISNFLLYQNVPNPFKDETQFSFFLPYSTHVRFSIYDILGQRTEVPIDKEMNAGKHRLRYQTKNLLPGYYLYRIETPKWTDTKRMIIK